MTSPLTILEQLEPPEPIRTAEDRRDHEQRVFSTYRGLSPLDGRAIAEHALARWDAGHKDEAETILPKLAVWVPGAFAGLHGELLRRDILRPGDLYRGADPATRDALLKRVDRFTAGRLNPADQLRLSDTLVALAWIGDHEVQRTFHRWRAEAPSWHTSLCVPLESYPEQAGWTLADSGERRDLYSPVCYSLVAAAAGDQARPTAVTVVTTTAERCGWCGRTLVSLLDVDATRPEVAFLGWRGDLLRIAICETCTGYATVFTEVDPDGNVRWSEANVRPDYLPSDDEAWEPLPRESLVLGPRRSNPYEANLFEIDEGLSQLGGHPSWQQDAVYPHCPTCNQSMSFVGQVHVEDLEPLSEGTYYAFLCAPCGVAATSYQQT